MTTFTEEEIRKALDGTFIAMHFSGLLVPMTVPLDFDPFSEEGQKMIRKAIGQKVFATVREA